MLKCFVACAFGHEDVDHIYKMAILKAASSAGCKVTRVDRIDHNDDIDDKIYELILKSDICIADLTYSRPSVYYEAGVFQGMNKPVIYTARSDHFRARDEDPHDIFRIHFDLQMKNIIAWRNADQQFIASLEKRIRIVSIPIIRRISNEAEKEREQQAFCEETIGTRCRIITDFAKRMLQRRGFSILYPSSGFTDPPDEFISARSSKPNVWFRVICRESISVSIMRRQADFGGLRDLNVHPDHKKFGRTNEAILHCILVSMRPVSASRIRSALPSFKGNFNSKVPSFTRSNVIVAQCTIHVISPVLRPAAFEEQFRSILHLL
jgi:nucleoside 2-deoxyribosyltransferase